MLASGKATCMMSTSPRKPRIIHRLNLMPDSMLEFKYSAWLALILLLVITGCSLHYDTGKELESEGRYEEASIEYHRAFVDDPDDLEIQEALQRVHRKVAEENLVRYREYLEKKQYHKAFSRLQSILRQNPEIGEAQEELKHWTRILLTGKIEFEFKTIGMNLRLAEKMELQVHLNSPSGELLRGEVSYENGIFSVEDLLYKTPREKLSEYTLNTIGLELHRKDSRGFTKEQFERFIYFRTLIPGSVEGRLNGIIESVKKVADQRSNLLQKPESELKDWFPPRLVRYQMLLDENQIRILSSEKRREFAPEVLYLNSTSGRAFIDFGVLELKRDENRKKWSIRRKTMVRNSDDYFTELSRNLALSRYFQYEQAYRYVN
ncbi:MAG: hypothetical protein CM15mP45_22360 [Deltaproteobacteria bacterium]|nr:MAG: hypothetical protein CM15mP45_22360 [Deltaproteobacteria bacterium]